MVINLKLNGVDKTLRKMFLLYIFLIKIPWAVPVFLPTLTLKLFTQFKMVLVLEQSINYMSVSWFLCNFPSNKIYIENQKEIQFLFYL